MYNSEYEHFFDKTISAYITCPTSYLCDESAASNVSMCIDKNQVCDGRMDCLEGDDETKCGMTKLVLYSRVPIKLKYPRYKFIERNQFSKLDT